MKVTRISIGKTVNLGNYESLRVEVQVEQETGAETLTELTAMAVTELKQAIAEARNAIGK